MVGTYGSRFRYPHCQEYTEDGGNHTAGGYSEAIVVDENYALRFPDNLDLAAATPLLCAGITLYSPLIYYGLRPHHKYGVVGLGGLGHMGVKFGVAFGAHTTVISRGTAKREQALEHLKAHDYIDSTNADEFKAHYGTFDILVSTVSSPYDVSAYLKLLKSDGKFIVVGVPPGNTPILLHRLIGGRKTIAGSLIGGIQETQEMLDFCGRNNIVCDIELISAAQINEAYERTLASDVRYRFVIDTATL
jgi:alcohol dehydrogenase (NADP+)